MKRKILVEIKGNAIEVKEIIQLIDSIVGVTVIGNRKEQHEGEKTKGKEVSA